MRRWFPLALLALAGCATGPKVYSDYDRSADFGRYTRYSFVDPLGTDGGNYSSLLSQRLRAATRREMESRGYVYDERQPDLLVNFHVQTQDKTQISTYPAAGPGWGAYYGYRGAMYSPWAGWGRDVDVRQYTEGTLNVDIVDAARRQLVWEGAAVGRITQKARENPGPAIDAVVTQLFATYPFRAGSPTPAPQK